MADEVHKQEFFIRDLPTRSVILYPTRAEIVRDISNVKLKVCRHFILSLFSISLLHLELASDA